MTRLVYYNPYRLNSSETRSAIFSLLDRPTLRGREVLAECPFCAADYRRGEMKPRRPGLRLQPSECVSVSGDATLMASLTRGFVSCSHCRRSWPDMVEYYRDRYGCADRREAERRMAEQGMIHPPEVR